MIHALRHGETARQLGERRRKSALVPWLTTEEARDTHSPGVLGRHGEHVGLHILQVGERRAQILDLAFDGGALAPGLAAPSLGFVEVADRLRRRGGPRRSRRGGRGGIGPSGPLLLERSIEPLAASLEFRRQHGGLALQPFALGGHGLHPTVETRRSGEGVLALEPHLPGLGTESRGLALGGLESGLHLGLRAHGLARRVLETLLLTPPDLSVGLFPAAGQLSQQPLPLGTPSALDLVEQAHALSGETLGGLETPVERPDAQQPPGAALPLRESPRERILLVGPLGCQRLETPFDRAPLRAESYLFGTTLGEGSRGRGQLTRQEPSAHADDLGLDGAVLLGGARLPPQRIQLAVHLAFEHPGTFEVAAHLA